MIWPVRSRGLLALVLLLPLFAFQVAGSSVSQGWAALGGPYFGEVVGGIDPIADWVEDLRDDLEDVADELDEARIVVGGSNGPLDELERSVVANHLDNALAVVDRIRDEGQYPSLDPPDAGSVDTSCEPSTLPQYAKECLDLAQDAVDETWSTRVSDSVIGSHLKTIEHLITRASPHSYRTKAGIED
jgi:hypothetical protein